LLQSNLAGKGRIPVDQESSPPHPANAFTTPADLIGDTTLDREEKRLILRQWQHDAVKGPNPCADAIRGPILAGIKDALIQLKAKTI
jgi:hypothetical protein